MTITTRRHNDNDSEDTVATTVRRRRNEKYSVNTAIMAVEKSKNEYTPIVRIVC